ncbi:MAG TPA: hypothetical protein VD833_01805 [Vicinamibacterales bacterium]|nr:hypothetical protein [Vicinamibacterales bacterium]
MMRRLALALGLVASVVLLGPGCRQTRPEGDVVAVTNSPLNLDPGVGADEASQKAHQLLFSTLVRIDDDLRIVPELAESIEQPDSRGVTDPDMLRRVFHSRQAPPAGLNRVYYSNPHVDEPIDAATRAVADDERRVLYASAKRLMAEDIPYIGLWYKTNVAVFQPDITGMRWSPIADVTFLKDLREGPVR